MPPVRRDPPYSVQDVVTIIQNGESDVDIQSDDSDVSDDESVYNVRLDKANQEPSDVDIETQSNKRDRYLWQKKDTADVSSLHTPLQYFQMFVSEDMIESLARSTNEYSVQNNGRSVNTNAKEVQKVLGMYLRMGLVQMAGTRMYWETDTRHPPVADVMSRNRFQTLLTTLHFVNNLTASEVEKGDKLWKLRPWLDAFREKCLQVVPQENNSVEEMMIPLKLGGGVKRYTRDKPNPWGFKVWVRAGVSGMMLDFDVYQGSNNGVRVTAGPDGDANTYADVKMPYGVDTYDKYVGGVDLLNSLTTKYKFSLKSRRWYMYIFWHTIVLAVVNAWLLYKRHCHALKTPKKEILNMRRFQAQLASSLILVDTTPDTQKTGRASPVPAGSPLNARKRPSSGDGSPNGSSTKRSRAHPPLDVRKDLTGHFPMKVKRGRCRHCTKGYTNTQCSKCDLRLCFSDDKNCFWDYHCK